MTIEHGTDAMRPEIERQMEALRALAPADPFWNDMETYLPTEHFFVALDEGRVVGVLCALPLNTTTWYATSFYVDPAVRGNGVGRELMMAAIGYHAAYGRTTALTVADDRKDLYTNFGFVKKAELLERRVCDSDQA